MIELKDDRLVFRFPEVHEEAGCEIAFQRTLRIPDDNREYPLPPGLGQFPLEHVDDFKEKVLADWVRHGGVFLPMYQAEAMWIRFSRWGYPCAVKIAAGKISAITGEEWRDGLSRDPQDYVVTTEQPWIDGFAVQKGKIRQFVAMPLGDGYTAEEQLIGKAEWGGLQIVAYPMKRHRYEEWQEQQMREGESAKYEMMDISADFGLAPGGLMRQEIYEDSFGYEAWDQSAGARCFVHIANSLMYQEITGKVPPTEPTTAKKYMEAGLPWFEYYDKELKALEGAKKLARLDSVAAQGVKKGQLPLPDNESVEVVNPIQFGPKYQIRDGSW